MNPLDSVILSAVDYCKSHGMAAQEIAQRLTENIEEKQNRYKWRVKILRLCEVAPKDTKCKYTGNFLEDLDL